MAEETRVATGSEKSSPGPFLAKIVSHLDPTYMGTLEVQLLHEVGNDDDEGQLHQVKYLSPFAGQTSVDFVGEDPDDYDNTQKSYGMWAVPPDVGNIVMVIFVDGDPRKGYWIGCVPDLSMNFQVPGHAATSFHVDGTEERVPVAEYNKIAQASTVDPTQIKKPASPLQDILQEQGLLKDDTRGITTSSARREVPSAVFGISTPGPIDKKPGAKKGRFGKSEHRVAHGFVSRLGGSSFVMDDGDDKFLRKTPASEGPPEYAAVEQGETDGQPDILHNELIRIRTRTGHQILLHNSEDLIYIGNAKGTTWIELTSNGKIDIYAKDSISVHTENDINFTADRDINFTAKNDINLNATGNINATATKNTQINSAANLFTATGATNINSGAGVLVTGSRIDLNGPAAAKAPKANKASRIPMTEPWAGHENLAPASFKPASTKAVATPVVPAPAAYNKYSTTTDTFAKIKPPAQDEQEG
jgi:hypothetical protein